MQESLHEMDLDKSSTPPLRASTPNSTKLPLKNSNDSTGNTIFVLLLNLFTDSPLPSKLSQVADSPTVAPSSQHRPVVKNLDLSKVQTDTTKPTPLPSSNAHSPHSHSKSAPVSPRAPVYFTCVFVTI